MLHFSPKNQLVTLYYDKFAKSLLLINASLVFPT